MPAPEAGIHLPTCYVVQSGRPGELLNELSRIMDNPTALVFIRERSPTTPVPLMPSRNHMQ